MIVKSLWIRRKYDPSVPELLTAWDEYSIEENPDGFEADVEQALDKIGSDLMSYRVIDLVVYTPAILNAFEPVQVAAKPLAADDAREIKL